MKKIKILSLLMILVLALSACGKDSGNENGEDTSSIERKKSDKTLPAVEEALSSEKPKQQTGTISTESALLLIEEKYGKAGERSQATGNENIYEYVDAQTIDGMDYYNFNYSWLVYDNDIASHIASLGNILVAVDGSEVLYGNQDGDEWNTYNTDSDEIMTFIMQPSSDGESVSSLILYSNSTFSFSYDPLSSYLPYGHYEMKDGMITCKTSDGLYTYVFDIINDDEIQFNAGSSSEVNMTSNTYSAPNSNSIYKAFHSSK